VGQYHRSLTHLPSCSATHLLVSQCRAQSSDRVAVLPSASQSHAEERLDEAIPDPSPARDSEIFPRTLHQLPAETQQRRHPRLPSSHPRPAWLLRIADRSALKPGQTGLCLPIPVVSGLSYRTLLAPGSALNSIPARKANGTHRMGANANLRRGYRFISRRPRETNTKMGAWIRYTA
jgi:hypothetical protein